MSIEGSINIDVLLNKHKTNHVRIQSSRPVYACKVFHGKHYSEALQLLPLLFNICGVAQSCAGVRACEQAMGLSVSSAIEQQRDALVNMETLREHLWRLWLEWPLFTHSVLEQSAMAEMIKLQGEYQQALNAQNTLFMPGGSLLQPAQLPITSIVKRLDNLLQHRVFTVSAAQWLTFTHLEELTDWAQAGKTTAAKLIHWLVTAGWSASGACQSVSLPELDILQLNRLMLAEDYVQHPQWRGECCETSSLTRVESPLLSSLKIHYANGLLVRLVARLTEIAQLSEQLNPQQVIKQHKIVNQTVNPGIGQTAAARGQLIHRVKIHNEKIEYYQILAPTEWNFHPEGVVLQALGTLQGDSAMIEQQAHLLINAIDPCVAYKLQITD